MRNRILTISLLVQWIAVGDAINADLLWLKGQQEPVSGLLIKQTSSGDIHWLLYKSPTEVLTEKIYSSQSIKSYLETIDTARLQRLSPNELAAYRNYAEELSTLKTDNYAQDTAKRLFLICLCGSSGRNPNQPLAQSAAKNLIRLVDSANDYEQYLKLGKLYAGELTLETRGSEHSLPPETIDSLTRLLRMVRQEKFAAANLLLAKLDIQSAGDQVPPGMDQLVRSLVRRRRLSEPALKSILELEFKLRFGRQIANDNAAAVGFLNPAQQLHFPRIDEISPFDLTATIFRNRNWISPSVLKARAKRLKQEPTQNQKKSP